MAEVRLLEPIGALRGESSSVGVAKSWRSPGDVPLCYGARVWRAAELYVYAHRLRRQYSSATRLSPKSPPEFLRPLRGTTVATEYSQPLTRGVDSESNELITIHILQEEPTRGGGGHEN